MTDDALAPAVIPMIDTRTELLVKAWMLLLRAVLNCSRALKDSQDSAPAQSKLVTHAGADYAFCGRTKLISLSEHSPAAAQRV